MKYINHLSTTTLLITKQNKNLATHHPNKIYYLYLLYTSLSLNNDAHTGKMDLLPNVKTN